jgi:NAD(P)-dependent dehydrogenase (short-subunit alcohol dehydrogenase family)
MASRYRSYPLEALGFSQQVLFGQTAVVTGGGAGIGREVSFLLAQLGAAVIIAEISSTGADTARDIIASGGQARFIQTDVSSEESVRALFDSIRTQEETVHILINNATYCPVIPLLEMSTQEWDQVIHVNLRGTFLCSRFALELMLSQQQGTIVNMFSAPVMPYLTAYTASKEGVRSMVHSLAGELEGKPIHVIGYGPGMVETPGGTAAFQKLAPLIDMSYDQLVQSGFNPGYEGLIPAYDAALVLAHILCRPAEYHNQTITMEEAARKLPNDASAPESDFFTTVINCKSCSYLSETRARSCSMRWKPPMKNSTACLFLCVPWPVPGFGAKSE